MSTCCPVSFMCLSHFYTLIIIASIGIKFCFLLYMSSSPHPLHKSLFRPSAPDPFFGPSIPFLWLHFIFTSLFTFTRSLPSVTHHPDPPLLPSQAPSLLPPTITFLPYPIPPLSLSYTSPRSHSTFPPKLPPSFLPLFPPPLPSPLALESP